MTDRLETFSDMSTHLSNAATGTRQHPASYVAAEDFARIVEGARGLAVVDFTADWCPPCRMMAPVIDALARDASPETVVVKVDADAQAGLTARFGVMSLPTLLFFRDGHVIDRVVGALSSDRLRAKVQDLTRPA